MGVGLGGMATSIRLCYKLCEVHEDMMIDCKWTKRGFLTIDGMVQLKWVAQSCVVSPSAGYGIL